MNKIINSNTLGSRYGAYLITPSENNFRITYSTNDGDKDDFFRSDIINDFFNKINSINDGEKFIKNQKLNFEMNVIFSEWDGSNFHYRTMIIPFFINKETLVDLQNSFNYKVMLFGKNDLFISRINNNSSNYINFYFGLYNLNGKSNFDSLKDIAFYFEFDLFNISSFNLRISSIDFKGYY